MKRALVFNQLTSPDGVPVVTPPAGWELKAVHSESAAVDQITDAPYDAIIAACPEPTQEALKLLLLAKEGTPSSARLLLTADPGGSASVSLNRVAHEHLRTPITELAFEEACTRAMSMHRHLSNVRLRAAMAKVESLPSFPHTYHKIVEELENGGRLDRIAGIVLQDPALTAKVLQLVNSPFFGLRRQVHDTSHAIGLLGIQNLLSMVMALEVFTDFDSARTRVNVNRAWNHAALTAMWAKKIMETERRTSEETNMAFVAGMLHDCGRLVLASNFPDDHVGFVSRLEADEGEPFIELERQALGASHADAGAYLLDSWELPSPIVEAVAYHHEPRKAGATRLTPLTAVHVAEMFQSEAGADGIERPSEVDYEYLEEIGLADRVPAWREACDLDVP